MMGVALIKRAKSKYRKILTGIRDQHSFNFGVYPKPYIMNTSYWKTTAVALTKLINIIEVEGKEKEGPIWDTMEARVMKTTAVKVDT